KDRTLINTHRKDLPFLYIVSNPSNYFNFQPKALSVCGESERIEEIEIQGEWKMKVEEKVIGKVEGEAVKAFTVSNSNGMEATFLEWGCAIQEIRVPDRAGKVENVVLGYETLDEYVNDQAFLGVVVGRVAGRI